MQLMETLGLQGLFGTKIVTGSTATTRNMRLNATNSRDVHQRAKKMKRIARRFEKFLPCSSPLLDLLR